MPALSSVIPASAIDMIGRLTRSVAGADLLALPTSRPALVFNTPVKADADTFTGTFLLTQDALRSALMDMGEAVSAANIELAGSLTTMGLALTPETLIAARVALARAPGSSGAAYALAQSLGFPATPGILKALTAVTAGVPASRALPAELMEWLSLAVTPDMEPDAIAAQLHMLLNQRARSVEGHLAGDNGEIDAGRHSRTLLLRLAASEDTQTAAGADALAAHIEGQQLVNLAAQTRHEPPGLVPLYFAIPLQLPGEQTMLEMAVQPWDDTLEADADEDAAHVQVTVRFATTRLGRVQVTLTGTLAGSLVCAIGAERPATRRLLDRRTEELAAALTGSGWAQCKVTCRTATDWRPLWAGGAALAAPRTRMDRRA